MLQHSNHWHLSIAADVQVVTSMFGVGTNATEYTFETCLALFQALHILVVRVYAKLLFIIIG